MQLHITSAEALWFLPFVIPISLWVAWTDLSTMKILNKAVVTLAVIFVIVGFLALPIADYPWRLVTMVAALFIGILLNAAGVVGAGDVKFIAAAIGMIDPGDAALVMMILAATLLGAFFAHRLAKHTPLRNLAPDWESWSRGRKFPMGFALGGTLSIYICLGAFT